MWDSIKTALTSGNFWTGAIVGGVVAVIASNPEAQKAILKGAAKGVNLLTSSLAEAKEKFSDAKAEVEVEAGREVEAEAEVVVQEAKS